MPGSESRARESHRRRTRPIVRQLVANLAQPTSSASSARSTRHRPTRRATSVRVGSFESAASTARSAARYSRTAAVRRAIHLLPARYRRQERPASEAGVRTEVAKPSPARTNRSVRAVSSSGRAETYGRVDVVGEPAEPSRSVESRNRRINITATPSRALDAATCVATAPRADAATELRVRSW